MRQTNIITNQFVYIFIVFVVVLFCIFLCSCFQESAALSSDNATTEPSVTINETPISTPIILSAESTPSPEPYTTIILGSTGDIMCHLMQLKDAQHAADGDYEYTLDGDESYAFDHWFKFISPSLEYADLMIGNLETTIASDNSLLTGYPFFATPKDLLPSLQAAGFDVLVSGNNHILDKEQLGLISTVNALDEYGIYHTGAWASAESKNVPLVIDVKGVKIGIISATCSLNDQDRLLSQDEKSYMYTMTDDLNEISRLIALSKSYGADVIVVCPHWGYENSTMPDAQSIALAQEYIKSGADIVFAHHPHVLQPVDMVTVTLDDGTQREGIVFWSLGNFISNQMSDLEMLTGAIAYVGVTKNNSTGAISLDYASYVPIWTYISYDRKTDTKSYCVLPVGEVLDYPENIDLFDAYALNDALNAAWELAVKRLGNDTAQPLRSVPAE